MTQQHATPPTARAFMAAANDHMRPVARTRRARRDALAALTLATGSLAMFLVLLGCVFAAVALYYRWH